MAHLAMSRRRHGVRIRGGEKQQPARVSVQLESVVRVFGRGANATRALDGVSLSLAPGRSPR